MNLLTHYVLSLALTAASSAVIGWCVLFGGGERRTLHKVFALYSLSLAWWAGWQAILGATSSLLLAWWAGRLLFVGVIFLPTFLFHMLTLALEVPQRRTVRFFYGIAFILLPFIPSSLFVRDVAPFAFFKYFVRPGPVLALYGILFNFLILECLRFLVRQWSSGVLDKDHRFQAKILFIVYFFGYITGNVNWLYMYQIYIPYVQPFLTYGIASALIFEFYAVFRYRTLGVRFRSSFSYTLSIVAAALMYLAIMVSVQTLLKQYLIQGSIWVALLSAMVVVLIFSPLREQIEVWVDRFLFGRETGGLLRRLEHLERELSKSEKMKAVALLASGMAHEIKNPLTAIKTFADYLPEKRNDPEFMGKFSKIVGHEIDRISEIVQQVLDFARPKPLLLVRTDIHRLLEDTLDLLSAEFLRRGVEIKKVYSGNVSDLRIDPSQIRQVFLNVILNALEAMEGRPENFLTIATWLNGAFFEVSFQDTGPGISEKDLTRVFDPFYTSKEKGTGLGLCVVRSIVEEHGGKIEISSLEGSSTGTVVKLQIPYSERG